GPVRCGVADGAAGAEVPGGPVGGEVASGPVEVAGRPLAAGLALGTLTLAALGAVALGADGAVAVHSLATLAAVPRRLGTGLGGGLLLGGRVPRLLGTGGRAGAPDGLGHG